MEQKWYQQTWAIIVLLWLFFPVGLYLMWRQATWRAQIKWAVSGVLAILVVIVVVALAVGGGTDDADQVVVEEGTPGEPSPTALSEPEEMDSTDTPIPLEPTQTPPPPEPSEPPQPTSSPSFVFQQASEFPLGSPERTVAEYAAAWRDQDWQRMVNFTQLTWLDNSPDAVGGLAAAYDFKILRGFEVTRIDTISEVASDVTFVVQYEAFTDEVEKKEITARVIKETAPYETSAQGQWGVNPISTLSETDIE